MHANELAGVFGLLGVNGGVDEGLDLDYRVSE